MPVFDLNQKAEIIHPLPITANLNVRLGSPAGITAATSEYLLTATSGSPALFSIWFCPARDIIVDTDVHAPGLPWSNILPDGSTTASKDRDRQFFSCPARGVLEHCGVV